MLAHRASRMLLSLPCRSVKEPVVIVQKAYGWATEGAVTASMARKSVKIEKCILCTKSLVEVVVMLEQTQK